MYRKQKGLYPPFVRELNLQRCCLDAVPSDLHTPSFLSLSRAPCRNSRDTSSFSSSHCITNCSNHLQEGQERQQVTARNRAPWPDWQRCHSSKCCESLPLLDFWMLLSVRAAKVPKNTAPCAQATSQQWLYKHNTAQPLPIVGPVLVLSFSQLSFFFKPYPFLSLSTSFNFAPFQTAFSSPYTSVPDRTRESSNTATSTY